MKKFLIIFLLIPNIIFAQDFLSKFTKLKEEIEYIETQKLEIKTVSIAPSGDWVIVYGDFGYSYNNLPSSAEAHLKKNNTENYKIKDFDFLNDTSWVCLSRHNAFALKYTPQSLVDELKKLNKSKESIFQLAYSNGKWAIVYGKGEVATYNVDQELETTIKQLQKEKRLIKSIEFSTSGWIILYGKNDYKTNNISTEIEAELKKLKDEDAEINHIVFFNAAWMIIYNDNKYVCNF
ncbi:MAG: hypothetical protein JXL97_14885 [Bacteroidales bacterium]|nr:hypothetical protein [Bacteroidales bacterium]